MAGRAVIALAATSAGGAAEAPRFRLITLDPGHFHAALVQKFMYADVDPEVHVYAPAGDDVQEHLKRIDGFNTRAKEPTRWVERVYTGPDFLDEMIAEKAGQRGGAFRQQRRARQTTSRSRSRRGCTFSRTSRWRSRRRISSDSKRRSLCAEQKGVLLYDIMTERFEITHDAAAGTRPGTLSYSVSCRRDHRRNRRSRRRVFITSQRPSQARR